MKIETRHLLQIHLATLLFGVAGLFGKWLPLHPIFIVLGRVLFASMSLGMLLWVSKQGFSLKRGKDAWALSVLGVMLAFHWVAFFYAIQLSTVAIGLLTFSTFPVVTALLEPLFFKEKGQWQDFVIASVTFLGVALVIPDYDFKSDYTKGAIWGVLSGLSFAFLAILNRKYVRSYSGIQIAFFQDLVALLVLSPFFLLKPVMIDGRELLLLVLLGVVFTAVSHSMFINGLKTVKAKVASVIGSLEPVYGIAAAILFFNEIPGWRELVGGCIILGMAFYVSIRR